MKLLLVVASIALVSVGIALVCCSQGYFGSISIGSIDPLWASVLVTVVLVAINAYYAWQARQTIAEMEKARKAEFMPHVKATLAFLGPVFLILRLTNVGKGPAMDVKTTITFFPSNESRLWEQRIMSPGESIRVFLPEGNLDKVCERAAKISVKGICTDIFGKPFEVDEVMDTKDFIEKIKQLEQLLESDLPRLVQEIKEEIRGIKKEISDLRREASRIVRR